jgi:lipopolysaccharide transport system ATP-binding protein
VSFAPVEDATTDYLRAVLEDSEQRAWHKPQFEFPDAETETHIQCDEYAVCIGGELHDQSGKITAELNIDQSFQLSLRYKLLKDVPFRVVPNFHFYDEGGNRFFIAFPEASAPTMAGEYTAICHIDPFQFNTGRFSVMMALSSYEMAEPLHFAIENALRFEVFEPVDSDLRRHGWGGALPGMTRFRLDWSYQ